MVGIFKHLFVWLGAARSSKNKGLKFSNSEKALLRQIDVEAAIAAHSAWKSRIAAYLAGNSLEYFRPDIVGLDHRCTLGQWLQSVKKTSLGQYPEIKRLLTEHQNFHFYASYIVSYTHAGKLDKAQKLYEEGFEATSKRVIGLLHQLQ
jgi:hypothetical protein